MELAAEGRVDVTPGDSAGARFFQMTMQQVAARLAADGNLSVHEIEEYCSLLDDPSYVYMWPIMLATWGRKAPR